ncbi:MAG: hypothetical protein PUC47_11955, partial [Oscillospiraceae bacterium]|nr:hypothetical protein [Oscillospiraceae bacterium]
MMQMLTQNDRDILRRLAGAYMEYALLPVQKEKRDLWKALNRFAPQRPMVNIDQLPWNELEASSDELRCQVSDPWWRSFELNLRRTLYQCRHFPADMVLEPFLTIPAALSVSDYGPQIQDDTRVQFENETASSHLYHSVLQEPEDLELTCRCARENGR